MMTWFLFIMSAAVIVFSGMRLTHYADQLSDCLNLGKVWIGIVLLGFVTSLPEAITSLSAVISLNANDLAVGNILGSNNFNPLLLVVMDMAYRKGSITNAIHLLKSHTISALWAGVLVAIVILGIITRVGFFASGMVAVLYFLGMWHLKAIQGDSQEEQSSSQEKGSLKKIIFNLGVCSIFVIGAAMCLASSSDSLAQQTGLGQTFFGSIFLAMVTSLPELVVTLSALKLGSMDLAVGNIFGSNMTNVFILSICELFYTKGAFLSSVSTTHILTGVLSIILTITAIAGIHWRNKKTFLGLGVDSFIMIFFFLVGTGFLYQLR